jgi:acyl-CoA thioester hydrolase
VSHELLAGFPVIIELPVQWGEMDAYGHVNNTVLFRYFESARMAYFERCGFTGSYERDKIGAILHSTGCRFRRPLFCPDTALVGTRVSEIGEDRVTMEYRVVSKGQNELVAEGSAIIVSYDYNHAQKTSLPPSVREAISRIEQRSTDAAVATDAADR